MAGSALGAVGALWLSVSALAQAGRGEVECTVTENGEPASGAIVLRRGAEEVARGTCGKPVAAPAGSYTAVVALDGALDGPEQSREVTVEAGRTQKVAVDFETGVLEVRIEREGRRAAGMAIIRRGGSQIGTLGSGVAAHLSVGRYEIVVRYRTDEKTFADVEVKKADTTRLDAVF
jgi:hypothetical protein